jgi:hypothetical protein
MTHTSRWGTISRVDALRVAMVSITSMAIAVFSAAGPANADPPPTQVITTVAVGPGGQPINGYQEAPAQGNVFEVNDCSTPSPSAVANNIYYCSPSVAGAGTCWPSTPDRCCAWTTRGTSACIESPSTVSSRRCSPPLHQLGSRWFSTTAHIAYSATAARGVGDDGYVGAYGCDGPRANLAVLCLPSQDTGTCIDSSAPVWTVKVGQLGAPTSHFPPPQTRAVTSAWFAGS